MSSTPDCGGGLTPEAAAETALAIIFIVVITVVVALRLYTRIIVTKSFGADDVVTLFAGPLIIACFALYPDAVHYGYGHHAHCISYENLVKIKLRLALGHCIGLIGVALSRVAIALLIMRLFALSKTPKLWLGGLMAIQLSVLTAVGVSNMLTCTPARKVWDSRTPGKCWTQQQVTDIAYLNCAVSIAYDFILCLLPAYFLRNVQLGRRKKIGIIFLLSLGFVTGACAIARISVVSQQQNADFTYTSLNTNIVSIVELFLVIFTSCMPPLRALFSRKKPITAVSNMVTRSRRYTRMGGESDTRPKPPPPIPPTETATTHSRDAHEMAALPQPGSRANAELLEPHENCEDMKRLPAGAIGKRVDIEVG